MVQIYGFSKGIYTSNTALAFTRRNFNKFNKSSRYQTMQPLSYLILLNFLSLLHTHTMKHIFACIDVITDIQRSQIIFSDCVLTGQRTSLVFFPIYLSTCLIQICSFILHTRSISPHVIHFNGQKQQITDSCNNFLGAPYSIPGLGFISSQFYCLLDTLPFLFFEV